MAVVIRLIIKPAMTPISIPISIRIANETSLATRNLNRLSLEIKARRIVFQLYSLPTELATSIIASTTPKVVINDNANGMAYGRPNIFWMLLTPCPPARRLTFDLDIASKIKFTMAIMPIIISSSMKVICRLRSLRNSAPIIISA